MTPSTDSAERRSRRARRQSRPRVRRWAAAAALGAAAVLGAQLVASPTLAERAGGDTRSASSQIAVSKSSVSPGAALRVTGSVPATTFRRVQLEASTGATGPWVEAGTSQSSRNGRFSFKVEAPSEPGIVRYRVHAPKTRGGMATVRTRSVAVEVVDPPGSRTNPYALGQTFRVGDWTIVVSSTDYDSYPDSDHDIFDAPEPGWTFVSFNATFTYSGEGSSRPGSDLAIDFLAIDNRVYDAYSGGNICGNASPDLGNSDDVGDMYEGASVTANDCVSVPSTLAHDGLWRFEAYLGAREFFVRAG